MSGLGIFETLFALITDGISSGGYVGIFLLMALESMIAPVPSEAVMPFAGFLIAKGRFEMIWVVASSGLGSIAGSLISYFMGWKGGKPFVLKFGRYLLLDVHHLEWTERFFGKYGDKTIFICRFIPVVRHLISIPAGLGKMSITRFSFYTIVGATIWNSILMLAGVQLKEQWVLIHHYAQYLDSVIIFGIVVLLIYVIVKRRRLNLRGSKINEPFS